MIVSLISSSYCNDFDVGLLLSVAGMKQKLAVSVICGELAESYNNKRKQTIIAKTADMMLSLAGIEKLIC